MVDAPTMERLAFIRYLYTVGVEQSWQPEPMAAASVLTFHDSVELFLQLAAERLNAPALAASAGRGEPSLGEYFELLKRKLGGAGLAEQEAMARLNRARIALKHHGTLPSGLTIEAFRASVTGFFEANTPLAFGTPFGDISLSVLVRLPEARNGVKGAQTLGEQGRIEEALQELAVAFAKLLWDYEDRKRSTFGRSPSFFGADMTFERSIFLRIPDGRFGDFADKVSDAIEATRDALRIIAMGLDYRRYALFRALTPTVHRTLGGFHVSGRTWEVAPSAAALRECLDFVVDSAIRLQASDYDISGAGGHYGRARRSLDSPTRTRPQVERASHAPDPTAAERGATEPS
jgi:hypothetical protein